MNRTSAIKLMILVFFSIGFLVAKGQTDTLYVLYENSEFSSKGSFGRISDRDSTADYPLDKGRRYEYLIKSGVYTKPLTFTYMNKLPSWSDRSVAVIEMEASSINKLPIKDNQWFANTEYDKLIGVLGNSNTVIFLGDKERIKDGKIYFTKVYFDFWAEE